MEEEKIIRVDFGSEKSKKGSSGPDPEEPQTQKSLERPLSRVGTITLAEFNIRSFFRKQKLLRFSRDTIATYRRGLKDHKLEDLLTIARKSSKADWLAHPGYYKALLDEIATKRV